jgi:UDP-glucuronate 4-epimerase
MKILITGGAGFIGSALAKKLISRRDKVVLIDNFNNYYDPKLKYDRIKIYLKGCKFKLYKGDIRDLKFLQKVFQKEKPDKVMHLAAMAGVRYSLEQPLLYGEVNFMGTLNLLELSRRYKVKNFVYASSSSVYGANKKVPFSETDRVDNPISIYAATKKSTELLAHVYSHTFGLNTTGLRFFTVYGPWGRPDMAYFSFSQKILAGKAIDVYNFGKMMRDFTYIDDIVVGIIHALDKIRRFEIINIGADKPEKLSKFISVLEENLGRKAKKNYMPIQPGDVPRTMADVRKLRKLGWKPTTRIEQGIASFVEWYKEYYHIA